MEKTRSEHDLIVLTRWHHLDPVFAWYVGVLAGRFADGVPELMVSMVTATHVSQDFSDLSWVMYNAFFRHHAGSNYGLS